MSRPSPAAIVTRTARRRFGADPETGSGPTLMTAPGLVRTVRPMTTTTAVRTVDIATVAPRRVPAHAPAAPRWARRAAGLAVLTTIPSALWRIAMSIGVPVGVNAEYRAEHYAFPSWGSARVFGLSFLLVGLAALTLGLVQPWGEVAPRWMPLIGGRRVRPQAAVVPAAIGAVLLTLLWISVLSNFGAIAEEFGLTGPAKAVVLACYAPLLAWGPLLGAVTASYRRRRRGGR